MKVSIIIASYNYEDYIKEAIESVLAQTYTNWELVIIDDGSSDNSLSVIKDYAEKDSRIKVFTHENNINKGLIKTVELGISKATGDYIAFLESDDIWVKDYLDKKNKILQEHPSVGIIFNDVELFGDEEVVKSQEKYFDFSRKILKKIKFPQNIFNLMLVYNVVPTFSCVMVKKELINKCLLEISFPPYLDWNIWLQLAYKNNVYYIPEFLTLWRLHKKSYISTSQKVLKNNNKIFINFIKNVFSNEKNLFKKNFLTLYYSFVMIFFKMNRSLINKIMLLSESY